MSTDATGLPSEATGIANQALNSAATTVSGAGARHVRSIDDRLAILVSRMTYTSLSFFFACFYFGMVYLQLINQNGQWKPPGVDHPATWLGVSEMALVLAAGIVYFWAQWAGLYRRNWSVLSTGLWIAAILTVLAIIPHIIELHDPGFSLQGGGYVSIFIATEGIFTVLLIITAAVLLGVANRARLGLFRESGVAVEAFGEYFGWFSAIALANFLALYVQPFFPIT